MSTSANAWRMRRRALAGDAGRFAYVEHTAEMVRLEGSRVVSEHPDVLDRDGWARANPAYGWRNSDEAYLGLYDELGPELFARECLCIWDSEPNSSTSDLDVDRWLSLADAGAERGKPVFGVDVGEDRLANIAVAWLRPDGEVQVMLAAEGLGPFETEPRLAQLVSQWGGRVMLGGPSSSLEVKKSEVVSGPDFASACGRFDDLLTSGRVHHGNQPVLNAAVAAARWRSVGSAGERALQLKDAPLVGPLAAAVRAIHGLIGSPAKPPAKPQVEQVAAVAAGVDVATMQF